MNLRKPDPEYVKAAHEEFPLAEQEAPISAKDLNSEFHEDWDAADQKWKYKRVTVTGTVRYKGPDIHSVPSFELSDSTEGTCEVLACLAGEEEYGDIQVGDIIVVQGNYLIESDTYGVCLKMSKTII